MFRSILLTVFSVGLGFSADVNLSGTVTDEAGSPIAGASVVLSSNGLSATTDASGSYSLTGTVPLRPHIVNGSGFSLAVVAGVLTLELTRPASVAVERFDMRGQLIKQLPAKPFPAGAATLDMNLPSREMSMMILRVRIDHQTLQFRYLPLNNDIRLIGPSGESRALSKSAAAVDILTASAPGYEAQSAEVETYESTLDFSLVAADCEANPSEPLNTNASGTGPHDVVLEINSDPGIRNGTIYRPADLGPGKNYPIFTWGNGGCSQNGLSNRAALGEIASHGYFIIADGSDVGGGGEAANMIEYIDWAIEQNGNPCSEYYQTMDITKLAADGFSCGGLMSAEASGDPRWTAIGITSSGLFNADDNLYSGIHTPYKIMNGGPGDIAYDNGLRDYEEISAIGIPIIYFSQTSAGHGGDLNNGTGNFNTVNLAWLNWQLKGDEGATGKALLIGPDCRFCDDPGWDFRSANME